jgi:hypothetical protein
MSSWSSVVALSGFQYEGDRAHVIALPRVPQEEFRCFWATGTGWGSYSLKHTQTGKVTFTLQTLAGTLPCRSCSLASTGSRVTTKARGKVVSARLEKSKDYTTVSLGELVELHEGEQLEIVIFA